MSEPWADLVWIFNRYIHVVSAMLLVGGTLFYAMVVPRGIDDLKDAAQLAVLGRLRWVFRWIVYLSTIALLITGALSWSRNTSSYSGTEVKALATILSHEGAQPNFDSWKMRSGLWFMVHTAVAVVALISSVAMIRTLSPPNHPIGWLRVSLILLLVSTLAASMTRHSRLRIFETIYMKNPASPVPSSPE